MKSHVYNKGNYNHGRSREGAWIEIRERAEEVVQESSRSREGAWIEISSNAACCGSVYVAPVRERGLKLKQAIYCWSIWKSLP